MKKCVIPISGGVDSTVILHDVVARGDFNEIHTISFNYGQRHIRELACARWQSQAASAHSHKVIDISFFADLANTSSLTNTDISVAKTRDTLGDPQTVNYVPFRNTILLSICCSYAESIEADTVYHGAALVDSQAGYWDGSQEFLDNYNNLIALNRRTKISVEAPLIKMSKKEIIELGVQREVDFSKTHTCYSGEEIADAENPASSSRIQGFIEAGFIDPVQYRQSIPWKDYNCVAIG